MPTVFWEGRPPSRHYSINLLNAFFKMQDIADLLALLLRPVSEFAEKKATEFSVQFSHCRHGVNDNDVH